MQCRECNKRPTCNFGHLCKECKDEWNKYADEQEAQEKEREKRCTWNGDVYADDCATCHRQDRDIWLIQFDETGLFGKGTVTGSWCMECVYKMTGQKEIDGVPALPDGTSIIRFKGIGNIRFIKKLREPKLDKASLDVVEVLKAVDFK